LVWKKKEITVRSKLNTIVVVFHSFKIHFACFCLSNKNVLNVVFIVLLEHPLLVQFPQQSEKSNLYPAALLKTFVRPSTNLFKKLSLSKHQALLRNSRDNYPRNLQQGPYREPKLPAYLIGNKQYEHISHSSTSGTVC